MQSADATIRPHFENYNFENVIQISLILNIKFVFLSLIKFVGVYL